MAAELASPTFLLLCRSLSTERGSVFLRVIFCISWNGALLETFNVFYTAKKSLHINKNKHPCFVYFVTLIYIFISDVPQVLGSKP
jgi:hypothetical protein